ncbi:MAG TPA: hypothetical protein DEB18_06735, partial [Leeuwenhoekiella sp.]|nr:hypothetical protein [Leeuwenhoekiella sp.]
EGKPVTFDLHVSANVANTDLYKSVVVNDIRIEDEMLQATLFNPGTQQATIPQVLLSYYDAAHQLLWVDHHFLKEGVRQQRKQEVHLKLQPKATELISARMQAIFVNGLSNEEIARKVIPNRKSTQQYATHIALKNGGYLKVELNNYLGNPR